MKKLKTMVLLGLTFLLGLTSCANTQESVVITNFELSKTSLTFQADGGSAYIQVFSALGIDVTIPEADKVWISATVNNSKKTVTFLLQPNELAQERVSVITINSSGNAAAKATLTITQAGAVVNISATPANLTYGYNALAKDDTKFFALSTNANWTLAIDSELAVADNITGGVGQEDGADPAKVFIYPKYENKMAYSRVFNLSFITAAGQVDRTVTQGPAPVNVIEPVDNTTVLDFSCASGSQQVDILSNVAEGAVSATATETWASATIEGCLATITVEENVITANRTCTLTLTFTGEGGDSNTRTITVNQSKAKPIAEVTPNQDEYVIPAEGGSLTLDVNTNKGVEWKAVLSGAGQNHFYLTKSSGTGPGQLTFGAPKNIDVENDIAVTILVTFYFADVDSTNHIYALQSAADAYIIVDPAEHNGVKADFTGSKTSFITTNVDFTNINVTSSETWAMPTIKENALKIDFAENTTIGGSRTATITLSAHGAEAIVTVTQEGVEVPQLQVTPDELTFGPSKDDVGQNLKVTTTGTISAAINPLAQPYFGCSISGEYITVTTLLDNDTTEDIEGTLTITATGAGTGNESVVEVSLRQVGAQATYVVATPAFYEANPQGDDFTTTITTNRESGWTLTVVDPKDQEWVKVLNNGTEENTITGFNNGTVKLDLLANRGATPRIAKVRLEAGSASSYITITQEGLEEPTLTLYPAETNTPATTMNAFAEAHDYAIKVVSNTFWTAHVAGCDWLSLDMEPTESKEGDQIVTLDVLENTNSATRTGEIVFTAGSGQSKVVVLTVTQIGADAATFEFVELDDFEAGASSQMLQITSNTSWRISITDKNATWLTLGDEVTAGDEIIGSGNGSVLFKVDDYASFTEARTVQVKVVAGEDRSNRVVKNFTVRQLPRTPIAANPAQVSFTAAGGVATVTVTMQPQTTEWTAKTDKDWLGVLAVDPDPESIFPLTFPQTGDNDILITAESNQSHEARSGKVILINNSSEDHARTEILVTQEAMGEIIVSLSPDVYNLTAEAQVVTPQIITNSPLFDIDFGNTNYTSNVDWITGNILLGTLTVEANVTGQPRTAIVEYQFGYPDENTGSYNVASYNITVNQAPQILTASPLIANIPPQGSQAAHISVNSNGSWTATTSASWITLPGGPFTGNVAFDMSVEANDSNMERTAQVVIAGGGMTQVVTVVQGGHTLVVDVPGSSIEIPAAATTITVPIHTTASNVLAHFSGENQETIELSWAVVKDTNDLILIHAFENNTTSTRRATVAVEIYSDEGDVIDVVSFELVQSGSVNGESVLAEMVGSIMPLDSDFDITGDEADPFAEDFEGWNYIFANTLKTKNAAPGGTLDITISTPNATFTDYEVEVLSDILPDSLEATTSQPWLTANKGAVEGNTATFRLTATENTSFYPRGVFVKVTLTGITGKIETPVRYYAIGQDPRHVHVEGTNANIKYSDTAAEIKFSSNIKWDLGVGTLLEYDFIEQGPVDWITPVYIDAKEQKLLISFTKNTGEPVVDLDGNVSYTATVTRVAKASIVVIGGRYLSTLDDNEYGCVVDVIQEGQTTTGNGSLNF